MNNLEKLLVTYPEFHLIGIRFSRKHINWLMARGRFPKPVRLGGDDMSTKAHWRLADIHAWIEERARASGLSTRLAITPPDGFQPIRRENSPLRIGETP